MLGCFIVYRARRIATAEIAEAAAAIDAAIENIDLTAEMSEGALALDAPAIQFAVFNTLVDDPASVGDVVDAFLGENMDEAASANTVLDASIPAAYNVAVNEVTTTADTADGTIVPPVTATTWNPADLNTVTLSGGNLIGSCTATNNSIVRATLAKASGKLYFEEAWSGAFRGNSTMSGIALLSAGLAGISSNITGAVCHSCAGSVFNNNFSPIATGYPVWNNATAVTICVAVDLNNDRIWFRLNNGTWNNSGAADPATNVGGIDISNLFATAGAAPVALFQGNTGIVATANFGATAFAQTVPSGFVSWNAG
jgi:hypothetical protein